MEKTKFRELCMAYNGAQQKYEAFQGGCHLIAVELVEKFKAYLAIPESQFSLYKISNNGEFKIVPPSLINALTLRQDSYWQFGIGLTVCSAPETLPQELILIHILIHGDDHGHHAVKYGDHADIFEIKKGDTFTYHKLFEYIHADIIGTYNEQLQKFIGQSTKRTIGFNH